MPALGNVLEQISRQARSLEQVIVDQDQRLCDVQHRIGMLIRSETFSDASARALSTDQVELAVSMRLALCCRYVDMLACADRIRTLAKAFGIRQATPFLNSLPTMEEWLLSQRNAGVSEDDLRLRIVDYQHRIKLLQRRFKGIPGLYQLL